MSQVDTTGRHGVVLTALGPDRPGLVNQLAARVGRAGGNIEDTRMAKLGGEFAVLIYVTGAESALVELTEMRTEIESALGVTCFVQRTRESIPSEHALHYRLEISGLDRPGIVESISAVLTTKSINVASLSSRVQHAPLTGTPMFLLEADLQVPPSVNLSQLRRDLGDACERENLDYLLEPGRA